jgi:hypothetical protein
MSNGRKHSASRGSENIVFDLNAIEHRVFPFRGQRGERREKWEQGTRNRGSEESEGKSLLSYIFHLNIFLSKVNKLYFGRFETFGTQNLKF